MSLFLRPPRFSMPREWTAVWTAEGWLPLTVVLDVFSRLIVGWAMASHREENLVEAALWMALGRRQPVEEPMHHSDRGSILPI